MKNILLIGCGGHSKSIIEIIESSNKFKILGLIGQNDEIGRKVLGYDVLGVDGDLEKLKESCSNAFVAIGQIKSYEKKFNLINKLLSLNFKIPSIFSSTSIVSKHSLLEIGSSIAHGVVINAGAKVGKYCTINTNALIEHDVVIGDLCHISTGVLINGNTKIGKGSFIGSGAIIREGLTIPPNTVISSGKRIMGWPQVYSEN